MTALRAQFFLTFAVMGSIMPFWSVLLTRRDMSEAQIGSIMAAAAIWSLVMPALMTLLADLGIAARRLIALGFVLAGLAMLGLVRADGFWPHLILFALFNLAIAPMTALQDGMYFHCAAEVSREPGEGRYHRTRVWGTVGFIAPSVVLYFLLRDGGPTTPILWVAAACAGLGVANSFYLPETRLGASTESSSKSNVETSDTGASTVRARRPLPTLEALRALREPHMLLFAAGMFMGHLAVAAYYTFYPIYLENREQGVGVDARWVGLIAAVGVVLEIFYILGFRRLARRFGLRSIVVVASAAIACRLAVLASSTTLLAAIGTQAVHGLQVLIMHVIPPIYLNHRAKDSYRNSIQGVYAMIVLGGGRITGNALAGWVAGFGLATLFWYAAAAAALMTALLFYAFSDRPNETAA